jgi:hypothetical protein
MLPHVDALPPVQRMPALLRSFPMLRRFGQREREQLLALLNALLTREGMPSVYAYALRKLAQVQLRDELEPHRRSGGLSLQAAAPYLQVLLSVLAASGNPDDAAAEAAYRAGIHRLLSDRSLPFWRSANWASRLDMALSRLDRLAPAGKAALVEALAATISHDGRMTVEESELLRAVCATVHCPLPPLASQAASGVAGTS